MDATGAHFWGLASPSEVGETSRGSWDAEFLVATRPPFRCSKNWRHRLSRLLVATLVLFALCLPDALSPRGVSGQDPDPLELPGVEVKAVSRQVARRLEPVYGCMHRSTTAHFRTEKDFASRKPPP